MIERSKKLLRQFRRSLEDEGAEERLSELHALLVAENNPAYAPFLNTLANLPVFFHAVDEAYTQYEDANKMAVRNLQLSSGELNSANFELERLNQSVSAMLNGLGQGLLFFGTDGICSSVYSKACLRLLGREPSGLHFSELLQLGDNKRSAIDRWIQMLFAGNIALDFNELCDLAPSEYHNSGGATILIEYRPMYGSNNALYSVLVILTDISAELEAREQLKDREKRALQTLRIAKNRNYFLRFVRQFRQLIAEWDVMFRSSPEQFKRDIHTLKSVAATFQLQDVAERLHALESALGLGLPAEGGIGRQALTEAFEASLAGAKEVLGVDFESRGNIRQIEAQALARIARALEEGAMTLQRSQAGLIDHLLSVPLHNLLNNFDIEMQETAERFGKMVRPATIVGDNISVIPECYDDLLGSFIHIMRNIIDHGIEEPDLRQQFGKSPQGNITITTSLFTEAGNEWIRVSFADDGSGIDTEALRTALAKRIPAEAIASMNDEELIQHVFDDAVSTRQEVTALSGRGVGMAAVKSSAEKLGGRVSIATTFGAGTTTTVEVPMIRKIILPEDD